jgi:polyisoprenoid-binding protein YceI
MKKIKAILATALMLATGIASAQTEWKVDASHSSVKFAVNHMVVSEVEGSFKKFDAVIKSEKEDFTNAQIEFLIDVNSIDTDNEMRDGHLKADDFFNAAKFPQIKFKAKSLKKISGNKYKLIGDMTIRDVTKPVELDVIYGGTIKDPYGNFRAGFKVTGAINRFDYGLKWNQMLEAGGAVVDEEVRFTANIELIRQS